MMPDCVDQRNSTARTTVFAPCAHALNSGHPVPPRASRKTAYTAWGGAPWSCNASRDCPDTTRPPRSSRSAPAHAPPRATMARHHVPPHVGLAPTALHRISLPWSPRRERNTPVVTLTLSVGQLCVSGLRWHGALSGVTLGIAANCACRQDRGLPASKRRGMSRLTFGGQVTPFLSTVANRECRLDQVLAGNGALCFPDAPQRAQQEALSHGLATRRS